MLRETIGAPSIQFSKLRELTHADSAETAIGLVPVLRISQKNMSRNKLFFRYSVAAGLSPKRKVPAGSAFLLLALSGKLPRELLIKMMRPHTLVLSAHLSLAEYHFMPKYSDAIDVEVRRAQKLRHAEV